MLDLRHDLPRFRRVRGLVLVPDFFVLLRVIESNVKVRRLPFAGQPKTRNVFDEPVRLEQKHYYGHDDNTKRENQGGGGGARLNLCAYSLRLLALQGLVRDEVPIDSHNPNFGLQERTFLLQLRHLVAPDQCLGHPVAQISYQNVRREKKNFCSQTLKV